MLTGKQRAFLRGIANKVDSTFQIGKSGVGDATIELINEALEKHEIVKVHVLENSLCDTREVCHEVSTATGAQEVQVIGSRFVLYKQSKENKRIDLNALVVNPAPKKDKSKKNVKPLYKAKKVRAKQIEKENSYTPEFRGTRRAAANKTGGTKRRTGGFRSRKSEILI